MDKNIRQGLTLPGVQMLIVSSMLALCVLLAGALFTTVNYANSLVWPVASFGIALLIGSYGIYRGLRLLSDYVGGHQDDLDRVLESMIKGNFSSDGSLQTRKEGMLGKVLRAKQTARTLLKKSLNAVAEGNRITSALDRLNTCVMIADADYNIVYMNESLVNMFHEAEEKIREVLPQFSTHDLIGKNIDIFHKNPYHQRSILDNLRESREAEFDLGGERIKFIASPVNSAQGDRVGVVVEWQLQTHLHEIESEIKSVVDASLDGDLTKRIPLAGKSGFYKNISYGINDLLAVNEIVIGETSRVIAALAEGDLDQAVSYDYGGSYKALANNINNTTHRLKDVIQSISAASTAVTVGSNDISQGNMKLSGRTDQQANNLEKTAASMEEMTGTVRQNAENANEANTLASDARVEAEKGGDIVRQAVAAMAEINTASNKISDIIGVIDEIAFQTNLLALNAAVEAAHAGDQGRGFAVVASEVRNLAQRSAEAAKEIKALIEDSVEKVGTGTTLVDHTGMALDEIVVSVKKVSDIIAEIAAANQEQSIGIEQVNQAVLQMDEMTQQNASMVQEIAKSSQSLEHQSQRLNQLMAFFNVGNTAIEPGYHGEERRGNDRPWTSEGHAKGGLGSLNVSSAKAKHLSWKTKIRSFLDGKDSLTMDQAVSHRDCDLGKWLYSEGMNALGHLQEMQALEKTHAEMHQHIKDIINNKERGDAQAAETGFSAVDRLSNKVVGLLGDIENKTKDVGKKVSGPPHTDFGTKNTVAVEKAGFAASGGGDEWTEF